MRPIADGNDRDIIARAKKGDMNAFETLVRKYQRTIYAPLPPHHGRPPGGRRSLPGHFHQGLPSPPAVYRRP